MSDLIAGKPEEVTIKFFLPEQNELLKITLDAMRYKEALEEIRKYVETWEGHVIYPEVLLEKINEITKSSKI